MPTTGSEPRRRAVTSAGRATTLRSTRMRTTGGALRIRSPARPASLDRRGGLRWIRGRLRIRRGVVDEGAALVFRLHPYLTVLVPGGHLAVEYAVTVRAFFFLLTVVVPDRVAAFGFAVVEERLLGLLAVLVPGAVPVIRFAVVEQNLLALLPVAVPHRP